MDAKPVFRGTGVVLTAAAAALAGAILMGNANPHPPAWLAPMVVTFWIVLVSGRIPGLICWAAVVATLGAEWIWVSHDPGWPAWMGGETFTALAGLFAEHDQRTLGQLRVAQAGLAERSRAAERNRIAHELHDVIAHSLTVSLLHITSARVAVEHEPEDAVRALAEAERVGRQTLAEIRSTIGLLGSELQTGRTPVPGLGQLDTLINDMRAAGSDVIFDSAYCRNASGSGQSASGPAVSEKVASETAVAETAVFEKEVSQTVGATAYRIVQEALTNASKHAPGSPVHVSLSRAMDSLDIRVDSGGRPKQGHGIGLTSMQERARLSAGRAPQAREGADGWYGPRCP